MFGSRARSASDAAVLRRKGHLKEQDKFIQFVLEMHQTHTSLEVMQKMERWIVEHRKDPRSSRLRRMVPTIGSFFVPLKLVDAFMEYDEFFALSRRQYVPPNFAELRHILNIAQVHASAQFLKLVTFDADGTLYADGHHIEHDNQMIRHIISLMRRQQAGGWAGGEKGLKEFVAAYQREVELNGAPKKEAKPVRAPQPIAKGSDTIYLGNGRVIKDDASKYPTRNELTGGFAGGELGLSVFKEKGDVPIAPNGQGTKQSSPLITAFVLGLAATGGGLLLSTIEEVGVSVVENGAPAINATASLGLDEKTKVFLTAAIFLTGVIGTVAGAQVLLDTMASKIRSGASKIAVLGAFWVVVFLAAKVVLEG
ncbi:hypothetical protein CHLNCDRAFT_52757 [Chlorella variabilis]|uniref:IMP-specific 5'-nucleotidase 1 n=1 Tax=Chlorella variabilis TaxID=554065 RepID=E1ZGR6_CHLVA|nr:hypothetical protein CHLNCDRAFT_52757 [Chlorella variabilis]EFN54801.1 hypothetical protein CHLNCDRAFT_52757 [Chlorella variabilis]|eukprot:XP_005846903.1 hypothetical protein CHLNCDRAFT_52757 [Chlorella variabilis]